MLVIVVALYSFLTLPVVAMCWYHSKGGPSQRAKAAIDVNVLSRLESAEGGSGGAEASGAKEGGEGGSEQVGLRVVVCVSYHSSLCLQGCVRGVGVAYDCVL